MGSSLKHLFLLGALVGAAITVVYHLVHEVSSSALWPDSLSVAKPGSAIVTTSTDESVSAADAFPDGKETSSTTAGDIVSVEVLLTDAAASNKASLLVASSGAVASATTGSIESAGKSPSTGSAQSAGLLIDEDPRPRNLHFAMLGDSVSRFQYIALAHLLHYGSHIRNEDSPAKLSLKDKQLSPGPNDKFHDMHKILLHPNEQCDCYRPVEWTPDVFVDNRYYYDPIRNNSLTFLLKYGSLEAHGRWAPQEVHNPHDPSFEEGSYVWNGNWSVAFRHLDAIRPRPNYVIFNAGHHPNKMYDRAVQDDIAETLQELNLLGIYKYTTCKNGNLRSWRNTGHEDAICARMEFRCINYNWTCALDRGEHYYDHVHLRADMNQRMNEELLSYLRQLE